MYRVKISDYHSTPHSWIVNNKRRQSSRKYGGPQSSLQKQKSKPCFKIWKHISKFENTFQKSKTYLNNSKTHFINQKHFKNRKHISKVISAMFCSRCGESLQLTFKLCPKCGTEIGNGQQKVEKRKIKVDLSLEDFKEKKARERTTFFRTKPNKLTTCRFSASGGETYKG